MKYFITGITGAVVPVVVEGLVKKDPDACFYFAIRKDSNGNGINERFESVVEAMDLDKSTKLDLIKRSTLVEINIEREKLGISAPLYSELVENAEKILHGAADVRFDQPYEKIKVVNVEFTKKLYQLYDKIKSYRLEHNKSDATLYYISTSYAYGIYKGKAPEDYPDFKPGKPDNTYAQTKAEAKQFILENIKTKDDQIVIFEPTIIGGDSKTARTRKYNLHYIVLMLGYLGKLPFLTSPQNQLDIVPVDWVGGVISDIMAKNEYHQGIIRLSAGSEAITVKYLHDIGWHYYIDNNPVPGHVVPKIYFVPIWFFYSMINIQKTYYRVMHFITRNKRYCKLVKGIGLLEGYFPYITRYKVFENSKSTALIEKYTDFSTAPTLQDVREKQGNLVKKGYLEKILADTLSTAWGGMVDYARLEKKTAVYKGAKAAYSTSRK